MRITDLAQAVAPGARDARGRLRPGEKLHEEMIAADDGRRALRVDDRYVVIQPDLAALGLPAARRRRAGARTASPTGRTPTTSGYSGEEIRDDPRETGV